MPRKHASYLKLVTLTGCIVAATSVSAFAQCPTSFVANASYPAGVGPFSVGLGDFNRDGKLDAVVSNEENNVSVYLGYGDGTFAPAINYACGTAHSNRSVVVGDFNGDGKLDLAVPEYNGNKVNVLLGDGDGTFQSPLSYTFGYTSAAGQDLAGGDFNRDGKMDLVSADWGWNTISVFVSNAAGTFQPAVRYNVGSGPSKIAIGDLNGDGKLDLAVMNSQSNNVSLLLGNGDGTFQSAVNLSVGGTPNGIAVGDFNRDGKADLAVSTPSGLSTFLGNGNGSFQSPVVMPGVSPGGVFVADLNMDGRLDLIVANVLLLGNGDGTFASLGVVNLSGAVAFADLNRDGKMDIATASGSGMSVVLQANAQSPTIVQQPISRSVLPASTVMFTVSASPGTSFTYQWRRNGVNLANAPTGTGSVMTGVDTPTLTVSYASYADNGSAFDCIVSNACGSKLSDPAGLAVGPLCRADFNASGTITVQDIFDYLNAWFAGCP